MLRTTIVEQGSVPDLVQIVFQARVLVGNDENEDGEGDDDSIARNPFC